ncbi:MAG: integrase core domain-containing protein [bacterium]
MEDVAAKGLETSPGAGKPYGVERVCRTWGVPRSSYYGRQAAVRDSEAGAVAGRVPQRRGPKPVFGDDVVLQAVEADLAAAKFAGDGHRKVWARIRRKKGIVVGRNRVLRIMRDNNLLSPSRAPSVLPNEHDGRIVTDEPNIMWATDGIRIWTVDEGWGWCFPVVEHWNAECLGHHVCKIGDRFAALEPIVQAVMATMGRTGPDAARGVLLRLDHGTQYLSDHFQHQIAFLGITPSFAFVKQPQTNGVVERFNRTLKEQAIYGRVFRNFDEVRKAVDAFVALYNRHWQLEKLGFKSPLQFREEFAIMNAA